MKYWQQSDRTLGTSGCDLLKVCDHCFGQPRARGSHLFHKVPWQGEPLVNIQSVRDVAKPYRVRQALKAIDNLEEELR